MNLDQHIAAVRHLETLRLSMAVAEEIMGWRRAETTRNGMPMKTLQAPAQFTLPDSDMLAMLLDDPEWWVPSYLPAYAGNVEMAWQVEHMIEAAGKATWDAYGVALARIIEPDVSVINAHIELDAWTGEAATFLFRMAHAAPKERCWAALAAVRFINDGGQLP